MGRSAQWVPGRDELLTETTNGAALVNVADGRRQDFKGLVLPVVFSPSGTEMVYGDAERRVGRLWRIGLDGGQPARLVVSKADAALIPCGWSGSGEILHWEDPDFSASIKADGLPLLRVAASGGTSRPLGVTTLVHDDAVAWAPGRLGLAVSAGGGREHWEGKRIATIDLKTGAIRYVTDPGLSAVGPAWSPDGREIAYSAAPAVRASGGEDARQALMKRRIWRGSHQLTQDAGYRDEAPMWSSDGASILLCRMAADNAKSIWLMRADGSDARQIAGPLGGDDSWFGYYGYIDWRSLFDWR
jgi:hypothetical protein